MTKQKLTTKDFIAPTTYYPKTTHFRGIPQTSSNAASNNSSTPSRLSGGELPRRASDGDKDSGTTLQRFESMELQ